MRDFPSALHDAPRLVWRSPASSVIGDAGASRPVPEETPIAFSYEGLSYAVMMATPTDLADFAVGFSLTEGIIKSSSDIETLEIVATEGGILLRMSLAESLAARFWERRRYLAGPVGCGLCGLESIAEAIRVPPAVSDGVSVSQKAIFEAMALLPGLQTLNHATGALHAAALWVPANGIVSVREDVGRHNALDKLIGAAAPGGVLCCQQRRFTDEPGIGGDGAESSCSRRAHPGCRLCPNRACGPSSGGRGNYSDRRRPA